MIARVLALCALAVATPAMAALSPDDLARVGAHPPANARLPAALQFRDTSGRQVTLGGVAAGRPLVVVFADYTCRHVCAPGLMLTTAALKATRLAPGAAYRVAVIGLDPKDGVADARTMTAKMIADPAVARATSVLLGDAAATPAAARALGYGYVHDAASDQFAHDAAVYVFAPDGRLAAVLPELGLRPEALEAALTGAAAALSIAERVAHLCYGLAAAHGRYGRAILIGLQALSALLLVALGAFLLRRRRAA